MRFTNTNAAVCLCYRSVMREAATAREGESQGIPYHMPLPTIAIDSQNKLYVVFY